MWTSVCYWARASLTMCSMSRSLTYQSVSYSRIPRAKAMYTLYISNWVVTKWLYYLNSCVVWKIPSEIVKYNLNYFVVPLFLFLSLASENSFRCWSDSQNFCYSGSSHRFWQNRWVSLHAKKLLKYVWFSK